MLFFVYWYSLVMFYRPLPFPLQYRLRTHARPHIIAHLQRTTQSIESSTMSFIPVPASYAWLQTADPNTVRHEHFVQRSEEHTSELQSLMRISYAVFCLKKKQQK